MFCTFEINLTSYSSKQKRPKPHGSANQKLCYFQMLPNTEKSEEHDLERSQERSVNTD